MINKVTNRILFISPTVQAGKENEPQMAHFKKLKGLGIGAFGRVYKVMHKQTKKVYAIK